MSQHHHQSPPMMDHGHGASIFQMPSSMQPPQLMNPPPQIFGGYNGLPELDLSAQMFGDSGLLDDSVEAKRRRIARVCQYLFDEMVEGRKDALVVGEEQLLIVMSV